MINDPRSVAGGKLDRWLETHLADLIAFRRDLHKHPERSGNERHTADRIARALRDAGIAVEEGIGGFGVVGTIIGREQGPRSIGLRADMDALPIDEVGELTYRSATPHVMHACGHDGHAAMLLGAARYLAIAPSFAGRLHVIFQPAEEILLGARAMSVNGLFDRFPCEAVYGLHNAPEVPAGAFAIRSGPMFASADSWRVTFSGRGGHGGVGPHLAQDVTYAQAHFIIGLQGIVGRNVPPGEPAVISVAHIAAGRAGSFNIIPASLIVEGTLRSLSRETRVLLQRRILELAEATAQSWGCGAEIAFIEGVGPLVNHADHATICARAARNVVGEAAVNDAADHVMASEDFAFMLDVRPGALIGMGGRRAAEPIVPVHTPLFDFNDDVLAQGVRYWVELVRLTLGAPA